MVLGCEPASFHVSVYCYWIGLGSCMEVFGCFGFGLKSKQKGLKGKDVGTAAHICIPFLECEGGVQWLAPAPRALFPGNIEAVTWKCVTLDPFSYEPCARISQDPFRESLLECPVTSSCDDCLAGCPLNEDADTDPFYKVSPGRGTQQPRTCLLRRSRRPCCRSCSGRPVGLKESVGTVSDITAMPGLSLELLSNPKTPSSPSMIYLLP